VQSHAPQQSFWLVRAVKALARWVVEKLLILYYVGTDPKVSLWAKRALLGALVYIFSLGLVLDFIPPIGEVDDVIAFVIAAFAVLRSIQPYHKLQAQAKARHWFGGTPPTPAVPPVLPPPPLS